MWIRAITLVLLCTPLNLFPRQSKLSKAVHYLSQFIASDYFLQLKETNNDFALVNSIYFRAVRFTNEDHSEALLSLTFATIPYKEIPIDSSSHTPMQRLQ